jgi:hypothetical protein
MSNDITDITRRDIIDVLLLRPQPFHGRLDLITFLKRVFNLKAMPSTDVRFTDAEGDIWKHMIANEDWDHSYLLGSYLELSTRPDSDFAAFLEACVHPLVISDSEEARSLASQISTLLSGDGFSLAVAGSISGRPLFKLTSITPSTKLNFEVALSFAGEDRNYVEQVAKCLQTAGVELFYDDYERATLWGKDLVEHLDLVFRGDARYCLMFISASYAAKIWPTHERRSALARALEERTEYILPVRFDDTAIPGLRPTIGYVDARDFSPEDLANLALEKLGRLSKDA